MGSRAASRAGSGDARRKTGVEFAGILTTSIEDASAMIRNYLESGRRFFHFFNDLGREM
jgi:hypothetical protein